MKHPVIAIGLDAADPDLVEQWLGEGHLKNLARLREQGTSGRVNNFDYCQAETPWIALMTGCHPQKTGFWCPYKFHRDDYRVEEIKSYDYKEYPPFYALGDDYRVAVFDVPKTIMSDRVNGHQVLAWGTHSPNTHSHSRPTRLLEDLTEKHGNHPALNKDFATVWNRASLTRLEERLLVGIERRAAICRDLLEREAWDLFFTAFGETHSGQHYLWHLSRPDHPLYEHYRQEGRDPLLQLFRAVDHSIGEIIEAAPENARVVVFSMHGMETNSLDLLCMLFLPEIMYRWNFPGKHLLRPDDMGTPPPPLIVAPKKWGWTGEAWSLKHDANPLKRLFRRATPTPRVFQYVEKFLGASFIPEVYRNGGRVVYQQPAMWYRPYWSQMKAFALPNFSEGLIRINLKGREAGGIVDPADYDAVCDDITQHLMEFKDARTGKPVVEKVVRTRESAADDNSKLPDADLIVVWRTDPVDVIDSPASGRIGPVPFNHTGNHGHGGFLMAGGPGIPQGSTLADGHALDITPTILELMGAPIPEYFDGRPLLQMARD